MAISSMKKLLESGVHFGHRTHKWNPFMKKYIFTERNGIHIINLQLTVDALEEAYNVVRDTVANGGTVMFVGTKRQAQETIMTEAMRAGMPYVIFRWLGGFLTNWRTIRERLNELERLERMRDKGEFDRITKKEGLMITREIDKLEARLGGVRNMVKLPDLLFVVDVRREETAVHEANLLGIPVVGMVDTNCDPRSIDYVIPSNDDAIRAIKLMVGKIADAVIEGKNLRDEDAVEASYEDTAPHADDLELTDDDLLGAATLAKIKSQEEEVVQEDETKPAIKADAALDLPAAAKVVEAEDAPEVESDEETSEE